VAKTGAQLDRDIASSLSRKARLPRWNEKRGEWVGGDSRTLYAFTGRVTGQTAVYPGRSRFPFGPEVDVRVATRDEAERLWQSPLHSGWKVA
jgi:hypothetical protein